MEAQLDLRSVLSAILTCVTAGPGLGFNRAVLFLADDDRTHLSAAMAVGPATREEAHTIWAELSREGQSLQELLHKAANDDHSSGFQTVVGSLSIPLAPAAHPNPLQAACWQQRVVKIVDLASVPDLPVQLREGFGGSEVVCVPLLANKQTIGLIVADNAFSGAPIGDREIELLELFGLLAGLAVDSARICKRMEQQAKQIKEALDQLKATQERLIHSERLATVGAVVARVSHEIRNPLTTIGGFARSLSTHPHDIERVTRNSEIIVEEVEKLETLLKEMLDFTSPRPPTLQPTDLNRVVRALASVHRGDLAAHNVSLALDLAATLPVVSADRNQVQRVFLNLWQNAVQAMDEVPADRPRTLRIQTWNDPDAVRVAISDTGNGIPPDVRPRIFTPFFTTKPRGTGLGLAVAKKLIDDHHGNIEVETTAGRGTTFIVALPIVR